MLPDNSRLVSSAAGDKETHCRRLVQGYYFDVVYSAFHARLARLLVHGGAGARR